MLTIKDEEEFVASCRPRTPFMADDSEDEAVKTESETPNQKEEDENTSPNA